MRLRGRLALAMLASGLAAVLLVAMVGTTLSARFLEAEARRELVGDARLGAGLLRTAARLEQRAERRGEDTRAPGSELLAEVVDRIGVRVIRADPDDLPAAAASLLTVADLREVRAGRVVEGVGEVDGQRVAWAVAPGPPAAMALEPLAGVRQQSQEVGRRLVQAGLLAVGVAGLLGLVLGDRLSRPVRRLESTVAAVAGGDLSRRVPAEVTRRPDELGDLGRGVDEMATAIADAREDQRAFLRNVAHELRTPLTSIRGYAEGIVDGQFEDPAGAAGVVVEEAGRLERLVDDVMTLARLDVGDLEVDWSSGDLADVVRSGLEAAAPAAEAAGISLNDAASPAVVVTDPHRLRQVVDNLVGNALRILPSGGRVTVGCEATQDGARLWVGDDGPGLTPEQEAVAFERYELWRRLRGQREVGSGLGLAIVAELTRRLGATVHVDGHGPEGGARFTVELPADGRR